MGNDGGTIARRSEVVRLVGKSTKLDEKALRKVRFATCALTKQPLKAPLVGCGLGNIYNKESVVEYLLKPSKFGEAVFICPHLSKLRDVVDLQATFSPNYHPEAKRVTDTVTGSADVSRMVTPVICPVTLKEMNGSTSFEFNWACGCLYATCARTEVRGPGKAGGDDATCVVCGHRQEAPEADRVVVYPETEEELARAAKQLKARRDRQAADRKKAKKARKAAATGECDAALKTTKRRRLSTEAEPSTDPSKSARSVTLETA
ncbi:Protein RTF2 [Tieghemiomyces parasiticus]|uniref:Protein RTF2 n=1 Tax=Tieghemiomyces parasiticus TaxID=78921 RepID=A0A9W8AAA9_9FUNG|nr:Protein RTF2 [Tieghemiomyces parasiticus]